jgi:quercetin dioxygenase-like cupin family protein
MRILRHGDGHATLAPEATFTGQVMISSYFQREAPSRLVGAAASFPPGSRTPWKTNPNGQTLIVTSGTGWVQCEGEDIVEVHAGDLIWCPPGQRHWEGATPDQSMTYLALHEGSVAFGDAVTDEQYQVGPPKSA